MSDIRLDLGPVGASLDLVDADQLADQRPFWFSTLADGFNLGSPEASRIIVASLMRDGDDERIDRYGNRTVTFDVQVHARTPHDLGLGEKALGRLVGTRTLLRWTPPGDVGSLTRFVVLTSEMAQVPNDLDEMREGVKTRTWRLTLTCEPHGTSEAPVSQTFVPSTVEPTTLDDASSLARWSIPSGTIDTLSLSTYGDGTSIRLATEVGGSGTGTKEFIYTAPAASAAEYVGIDAVGPLGIGLSGASIAGGGEAVAIEPGANYTRFWFVNPGTSKVVFRLSYASSGNIRGASFYIGGAYATDALNVRGLVVATVDGSVRTEGTITASRASGMSWLLAYSDPAMLTHNYSPAIPATWASAPAGRYVLYAKGADVGLATGTLAATITDASGLAQTCPANVVTKATSTFRPIGEFMLGSRRDGTLGALTTTVTRDGVTQTGLDLRLFRIDDAATLNVVEPASSVTSVTLEPPSLDEPLGGLWANDVVVRAESIVSYKVPTLPPGPFAMLVEANNSSTSPVAATVDYWPKWKGFAP